MAYKIIVLAPAAGGKTTLVNYLRAHTKFNITEVDEEILRANNYSWPDDREYKDAVIIPEIAKRIINMDSVIYFTYRVPADLLRKARDNGFEVVLLDIGSDELERRNAKRMAETAYDDISHWFPIQLKNFDDLNKEGLIDIVLDGHRPPVEIAKDIIKITQASL
jgi:GTPase SAR1 family protein